MKKCYLVMLISLVALTANALTINPQYTKFLSLKYRTTGNFGEGDFQSISGCFDGKNRDTLTLFPLDGEYEWCGDESDSNDCFYYNKWIVISKYGTVPSTSVNSWYPELVYEGDLDGNGRDEFAVLCTGQHGGWTIYKIYTYYNKKVTDFLTVSHNYAWEENLYNIARPTGKKGKVRIREFDDNPDHAINRNGYKAIETVRTITKFLK